MNSQDLAWLPEDVRVAMDDVTSAFMFSAESKGAVAWRKCHAELLRLARKNAELQFHLHDQELLAKANAEHATERLKRAERDEADEELSTSMEFELTHPSEDARDAARYHELRNNGYLLIANGDLLDKNEIMFAGDELDAAIDAAMAQESQS